MLLYETLSPTTIDTHINGLDICTELKARCRRLSKRLGGDLLPGEGYVNGMGYTMLYGLKNVKKAIEFFESNLSNFPNSENAYDSLGEAYMVKSDRAEAIRNYKKSLELDPNNHNTARMIRELREKKEIADG